MEFKGPLTGPGLFPCAMKRHAARSWGDRAYRSSKFRFKRGGTADAPNLLPLSGRSGLGGPAADSIRSRMTQLGLGRPQAYFVRPALQRLPSVELKQLHCRILILWGGHG